MADDMITQLEQTIAGLLFPSESDAPLRVFVWNTTAPFSPAALLSHGGYDQTTPIQRMDVDRFFYPVMQPHPWDGAVEQERLRRFTMLVKLLKTELSDLTVYKVGTVGIDVYVVGRDRHDTYLGVTTHVVET